MFGFDLLQLVFNGSSRSRCWFLDLVVQRLVGFLELGNLLLAVEGCLRL